MKKISSIIIVIAGLLGIGAGIATKIKGSTAVSVIGGADGPTSIFLAGKVGNDYSTISIAIGIVLICVAILLAVLAKRK